DGSVQCWGQDLFGQLGRNRTLFGTEPQQATGLTGAATVAAGSNSICAPTGGDTIQCWGGNYTGQLGWNNGDTPPTSTPIDLFAGQVLGVQELELGDQYSCAIDGTGLVWCWGLNGLGQLGRGICDYEYDDPQRVHGLPAVVTRISAGYD